MINGRQIKFIFIVSTCLLSLSTLFQNCAKSNITNSGAAASQQTILESKSIDILNQKCSSCHSEASGAANTTPGADPITNISNVDYLLRTRLVIPGEPELSPIYQSVRNGEMPINESLDTQEIQTIKDWISGIKL